MPLWVNLPFIRAQQTLDFKEKQNEWNEESLRKVSLAMLDDDEQAAERQVMRWQEAQMGTRGE